MITSLNLIPIFSRLYIQESRFRPHLETSIVVYIHKKQIFFLNFLLTDSDPLYQATNWVLFSDLILTGLFVDCCGERKKFSF